MSNTFRDLVEAVEDNNKINDGEWANWANMHHIEEVYGQMDDPNVSHATASRVLQAAIDSNGESLARDLAAIELTVWGQNFAGSWWNRTEAA